VIPLIHLIQFAYEINPFHSQHQTFSFQFSFYFLIKHKDTLTKSRDFSRCCTIKRCETNDPKNLKKKINKKNPQETAKKKKILFCQPNDSTVGARMKFSLSRFEDFINLKIASTSLRVKGGKSKRDAFK
jgi:hypothetical protein